MRVPSNLPKVASKVNSILRKIEPASYSVYMQEEPRDYKDIKYDVDLGDPNNWAV